MRAESPVNWQWTLAREGPPAGNINNAREEKLMKTTKMFSCAAALGLLAFGASNVQAAPILQKVSVQITLQSQGQASTNSNGNVQKLNVDTTKVTTKELIQLLDDIYSKNFPTTAILYLQDNSQFVIYSSNPNSGGTVLQVIGTDVMSYTESTVAAYKESDNLGSNAYNGTQYYTVTIHYDNGSGSVLDLTGYATKTYSGNDGTGQYSRNIKANVSGTGSSSDQGSVVANGTFNASGSGKQ
jgi:hypothetical protein